MEHLLLKAATTATDQGVFEAVISTASEDRDGDIVEPAALANALAKWAKIGKLVPLAYSHKDPATGHFVVVGHIDPATANVDGNQVIVKGFVDQSTDRGAETWRLVKSGTLSFSYGYLVPDGGAVKRAGKKTGYHITELDLYEISVVPVGPANNETRVLDYKSAEDLRKESGRRERELADGQIKEAEASLPEVIEGTAEPDPVTADDALALIESLTESDLKAVKAALGIKDAPAKDPETLKRDSRRLERELAEEHVPKDIPERTKVANPVMDLLADIAAEEMTAEKIASTLDSVDLKDIRLYVRAITPDEAAGVSAGEIKAVWSTAYINNLPDSAFLHIEPGGSKDSEGKTTPRSLRHFPVKDADGNVDMPHLRNALSRIPQSSLPQNVKDRCAARAQRMLDDTKSVEVDKEPRARSMDPLRKRSEELALEIASDGMSLRKSATSPPETEPELVPLDVLKRRERDHFLTLLDAE